MYLVQINSKILTAEEFWNKYTYEEVKKLHKKEKLRCPGCHCPIIAKKHDLVLDHVNHKPLIWTKDIALKAVAEKWTYYPSGIRGYGHNISPSRAIEYVLYNKKKYFFNRRAFFTHTSYSYQRIPCSFRYTYSKQDCACRNSIILHKKRMQEELNEKKSTVKGSKKIYGN